MALLILMFKPSKYRGTKQPVIHALSGLSSMLLVVRSSIFPV